MNANRRRSAGGFTLIEMMIAVTISLLLSIVVATVLTGSEGKKRTTTSVNDMDQAGNYALYALDKLFRSAGSGFSQGASFTYGCSLLAKSGSTQLLPRTTALPAPFANVSTVTSNTFRAIPLLILPDATTPGVSGATSDALIVMAGAAGYGEIPTTFTAAASSNVLNLLNTVAFSSNDIILIADQTSGGNLSSCMISQVTSPVTTGTATTLPLGGTYYQTPINGKALSSFSANSIVMDLGDITASNAPFLQVLGVGNNNVLFSYDLLNNPVSTTASIPVADGIFEMHALYGVANNATGLISGYEKPATSTTYSLSALTAGTSTAAGLIQQIKAVRVGLILRTSLPEKTAVSTSVTLFSDLGSTLSYTRTFTGAERNYRYRTVEATIPLRNPMILN